MFGDGDWHMVDTILKMIGQRNLERFLMNIFLIK